MKINDIDNALKGMGPITSHEPVSNLRDWRYYMPFFAGYHRTALAESYLPRYAKIWETVRPDKYMVIGILLGTNESWSMYNTGHRPSTIVACDYDLDSYNSDRDNMSYAYRNLTHPTSGNFQGELAMIRADSKKTELHKKLGPYDLIFVDGEHGYTAVKKDLDSAMSCVKPGGVVMVHDLALGGWNNDYEIRRAYLEWLAVNKRPHIEIGDNYFQLGLGLIQF